MIIFCRNCPSQYLNLLEHLPVEVQMESCTQVKIIVLDFYLFMVLIIPFCLSSFVPWSSFLCSFIHRLSQSVFRSVTVYVSQSVSQTDSQTVMHTCFHSFIYSFIHACMQPYFLPSYLHLLDLLFICCLSPLIIETNLYSRP